MATAERQHLDEAELRLLLVEGRVALMMLRQAAIDLQSARANPAPADGSRLQRWHRQRAENAIDALRWLIDPESTFGVTVRRLSAVCAALRIPLACDGRDLAAALLGDPKRFIEHTEELF